jgi:hydrogenase maturation protein HypF
VAEIFRAKENGCGQEELALGFHCAVAEMVVEQCATIGEKSGEKRVALSGGVFANVLLAEMCVNRLESAGFSVYLNGAVPGNDGGICLGQAWICGQLINEDTRG